MLMGSFTVQRLLIALLMAVSCSISFTVAAAAASPTTTIGWPTAGRQVQGDLFISGTASADSGVDYIELVVEDQANNLYWNGASWQAAWIRYPVQISGAPTSVNWSEKIPASQLTQGDYFSRAWTRSTAGNGDPVGDAMVNFEWLDRLDQVDDLVLTAVTDTTATVTWSTDSDDRLVSFDFFLGNDWITYTPTESATSWTFTGLSPGTTYTLGVTAIGDTSLAYSNQHYSPRSTVQATTTSTSTPPPPPPPQTPQPTTAQPTTAQPTTTQPTTPQPTTAQPTTAQPTTAQPTTAQPTTAQPITAQPTTAQPTPTPPRSVFTSITSPLAGSQEQGNLVIAGTASSSVGINYIELVLEDKANNRYWNGATWQNDWIRYPVTVEFSPTFATWSETIPASLLSQGNYFSRAWARDVDGNGDPVGDAMVNFEWMDRLVAVNGLTVSSITDTTATVTWSNNADDRRVSFDFFLDNVYVTWNQAEASTSWTFTDLTPGTTYVLGVTGIGDTSLSYSNQHYSPRSTVQATTTMTSTPIPTTAQPTTAQPTTAQPTTAQPTTAQPTTAQPTTTPPTPRSVFTTIASPLAGSGEQGNLVITGTASSSVGINYIELVLEDKTNNRYWNGAAWQSDWIKYSVTVEFSPTFTSWSETIPASQLTQANYFARAWARDVDDNGDPVGDAMVDFSWLDRPQAVIDLTVTEATATTATVTWTTDVDDRLVSFDFFVNNVYETWFNCGVQSTHTFTGLDADTTYQLGVTVHGDSAYTYTNQKYSPRSNVAATTLAVSPTPAPAPTIETVLWEDNFDTFDSSKWKLEYSTYGDGNNERQCYRPENVQVVGGNLVLRALHETHTCPNGSTRTVTSGMVRSKGVEFAPGQAIEFRIKLTPPDPNNQEGLWPAIWASGWAGSWPLGGEMDWFELMTAINPKRSIYSIHYQKPNGDRGKTSEEVFGMDNFSAAWHTVRFDYGVGGVLVWYLDGVEVHRLTDAPTIQGWPVPFDQATKEIKINLALGGNPGPLNDAALGNEGATFEVDYIRILSLSSSPISTPIPTTASPTTASPTSASPTTAQPTTAQPTTASPTTAPPTEAPPTTTQPTTAQPTTSPPTIGPQPSPTTFITSPPSDGEVRGDVFISGIATAESGVAYIELSLQNLQTSLYTDGEDWQVEATRYPVEVLGNPTSVEWTAQIPASMLLQGQFIAQAWTRASNGDVDQMGNNVRQFTWIDRPQAIIDLSVADTTPTTVSVEWSLDQDDRLASFDFFVDNVYVTYSASADTTSHTFTDLSPDTAYQLGVTVHGDVAYTYTNQKYSPRTNVAATTTIASLTPAPAPTVETVLWEDNFDTFDESKWKLEYSTYGDGNNERQCYRPENVNVVGGNLVLRAVHETHTCPNGSTRTVTSGMVRSKGVEFAPGQAIEFRVKLTPPDPNNQEGLWPAVWASGWAGGGWPLGGELDWLEVMTANNPRRSIYSIHYQEPDGTHGKMGKPFFDVDNFSASWHTIRFEYGLGVLTWYLDGMEVNKVTDAPTMQGWPVPFDQATKEIKINLALGGSPGPLNDAALGNEGATFEIDYIKIVSLTPDAAAELLGVTPSPATPAPTEAPMGFGCFPGDSVVQVKGDRSMFMKNLVLGDVVLVQGGQYEPVYSFGHFNKEARGEYLQLVTATSTIEMSKAHMIFEGRRQSFIPASMIKIGDMLELAAGGFGIVRGVRVTSQEGVYAPFTSSGTIVVNGIVASTFISWQEDSGTLMLGSSIDTGITYQFLSHTYEKPHRLWCRFVSNCVDETYTESGISTRLAVPHKATVWLFHQQAVMGAILLLPLFALFAITTCPTLFVLVALWLRSRWAVPPKLSCAQNARTWWKPQS